mgnify:CR=1 FL=1
MPEYLIGISLQEGVSIRIKAKDKEDALAEGERLASYWGGTTDYDQDEIVISSEHVHRDWSVDIDREIKEA